MSKISCKKKKVNASVECMCLWHHWKFPKAWETERLRKANRVVVSSNKRKTIVGSKCYSIKCLERRCRSRSEWGWRADITVLRKGQARAVWRVARAGRPQPTGCEGRTVRRRMMKKHALVV
jgi:hypothetical protein